MPKKIDNILRSKKDFLLVAFLSILPFFFFYELLFGYSLLTGDFSGSDLLELHLPFKYLISESLSTGKIPLWSQDIDMGFPTLAEGQSGFFYPVNVLLSWLDPILSLNLSIVAAFWISSVSMFYFAKDSGLGRYASLISSIAFSYSLFFVAKVKHINLIATASLFPFVLLCVRRSILRNSYRYAILASIGVSLQFFAGHPQITFYSILIYGFLVAYYLLSSSNQKRNVRQIFFLFFLLFVFPLFLASVQILPTLELSMHSDRINFSLENVNTYPFKIKNLVGLIYPYFYGNPAEATYVVDIGKDGVFWENAIYVGIIPLIAMFYGFSRVIRERRYDLYFFPILLIVSLFLMFGPSNSLGRALWNAIPGMNYFRFPARFGIFFVFSVSMLAGLGIERFLVKLSSFRLRNGDGPERFSLSWPFPKKMTRTLLIFLVIADLFFYKNLYVGHIKRQELDKYIRGNYSECIPKFGRVYNRFLYTSHVYPSLGWRKNANVALSYLNLVPPNWNILKGISYFSDRGWFEGGLNISRRNFIEKQILGRDLSEDQKIRLLGLYGVNYIMSDQEIESKEAERVCTIELKPPFLYNMPVYKITNSLPRFYLAHSSRKVGKDDFLKEFIEGRIDFGNEVVIENEDVSIGPGIDFSRGENHGLVEVIKLDDEEVVVRTTDPNPSFLVVNDIYYPGWEAEIDGKREDIFLANYMVRAVPLTPGEHLVKIYYKPKSFKIGFFVSSISWIVVVILLVVCRYK